jgi:hypothetical protein
VNQHFVKREFEKNLISIVLTFPMPLVEGWVPSLWKSERSQRRPSDRGLVPSAQR